MVDLVTRSIGRGGASRPVGDQKNAESREIAPGPINKNIRQTTARLIVYSAPGGLSDTEGVVAIYTSDEGGSLYRPTSFPDFEDLTADPAFSKVTAVRPGVASWERGDISERLMIGGS